MNQVVSNKQEEKLVTSWKIFEDDKFISLSRMQYGRLTLISGRSIYVRRISKLVWNRVTRLAYFVEGKVRRHLHERYVQYLEGTPAWRIGPDAAKCRRRNRGAVSVNSVYSSDEGHAAVVAWIKNIAGPAAPCSDSEDIMNALWAVKYPQLVRMGITQHHDRVPADIRRYLRTNPKASDREVTCAVLRTRSKALLREWFTAGNEDIICTRWISNPGLRNNLIRRLKDNRFYRSSLDYSEQIHLLLRLGVYEQQIVTGDHYIVRDTYNAWRILHKRYKASTILRRIAWRPGGKLIDLHDQLAVAARIHVEQEQANIKIKVDKGLRATLEIKAGCYQFKVAKTVMDLVSLGARMHNCVAGYVGIAASGRSIICWAEDVEGRPRICIELSPELKVRQVRGIRNSSLTPHEQCALSSWVHDSKCHLYAAKEGAQYIPDDDIPF